MNGKPGTLQELVDAVRTDSAPCYDTEGVQSKECGFETTNGTGKLRTAADPKVGGLFKAVTADGSGLVEVSELGELTDHAMQQMVERLDGPPFSWLAGKAGGAVRQDVVNALLKHRENQQWLIRHRAEKVRAVLSDRYTRFDNLEFVELLAEAVSTSEAQARICRPQVGDELRAYIVLPEITIAEDPTAIKPAPGGGLRVAEDQLHQWYGRDGGLHPGVYITNSEIGTASVRVTGGLFREICSNGAIIGWSGEGAFVQRHAYHSHGGLVNMVAEAVAVGLKLSTRAAEKFVQAQEIYLDPNVLKTAVGDMATKYGLTLEGREEWFRMIGTQATAYGRQAEPRLFDFLNAATYVAQSRQPAECELFERMAGDVLMAGPNPRWVRPMGRVAA